LLATYHVQVQEGNTKAEVVLIEHSFKLVVQKSRAPCEANSSPGVERSTLELQNVSAKSLNREWLPYLDQRVRSRRALLFMTVIEVCGKIATRPGGRIGAIEAQGIAVVTIDVDRTCTRTGSVMGTSPGIVVNERNDNSCFAGLILDVLHVGTVREVANATAGTRVLVLGLVKNDWATIGNLCLGNSGRDVGSIANGSR
jgi:hypothetical protein